MTDQDHAARAAELLPTGAAARPHHDEAPLGLVRPAGWADLGLVGRRTGQNGEGAELPAVAVRAHQVSA